MGSEVTAEEKRPQIQVVVSKREQKRQQMPPPPARGPAPSAAAAAPPPAAAPAGAFRAPAWAGQPPPGASLHVLKGGQLIERLPLDSPATLFGRCGDALDQHALPCMHALQPASLMIGSLLRLCMHCQ
jgi:hypothetical protein